MLLPSFKVCTAVAYCQELQVLDLGHNSISTLKGVESLSSLAELFVDHNAIASIAELRPLSILSNLSSVSLRGNPLTLRFTPAKLRNLARNLLPGKLDSLLTEAAMSSDIIPYGPGHLIFCRTASSYTCSSLSLLRSLSKCKFSATPALWAHSSCPVNYSQ